MGQLIAIGYDHETTAAEAAEDAHRLTRDSIVEADAIAVLVRGEDGQYKITMTHDPIGAGAGYGTFWGPLFDALFFAPAIAQAQEAGVDTDFREQVRDVVQPGTSALFLVVEKATLTETVEALSKHGGTVFKSSLPKEAQPEHQDALHGAPAS